MDKKSYHFVHKTITENQHSICKSFFFNPIKPLPFLIKMIFPGIFAFENLD